MAQEERLQEKTAARRRSERDGGRSATQMVVVGADRVGRRHRSSGCVIDWFPEAGSTQAGPIDTLWDVLHHRLGPDLRARDRRDLLLGPELPHAPGRGVARRPADPRQHEARGDLDGGAGDPDRRARHLRLHRHARHRGGTGLRPGARRPRLRRAVHLDVRVQRGRQALPHRPALPPGRRVGELRGAVQGRHPRLLGAGLPHEDRRGPGDHDRVPHDAARGRGRQPRDRLRRAVRPGPRLHAPDGARAAPGRVRGLAPAARARPPGAAAAAAAGAGRRQRSGRRQGAVRQRQPRHRRDRLRRLSQAGRRRLAGRDRPGPRPGPEGPRPRRSSSSRSSSPTPRWRRGSARASCRPTTATR